MTTRIYPLLTLGRLRDLINGAKLANLSAEDMSAITEYLEQRKLEIGYMLAHVDKARSLAWARELGRAFREGREEP